MLSTFPSHHARFSLPTGSTSCKWPSQLTLLLGLDLGMAIRENPYITKKCFYIKIELGSRHMPAFKYIYLFYHQTRSPTLSNFSSQRVANCQKGSLDDPQRSSAATYSPSQPARPANVVLLHLYTKAQSIHAVIAPFALVQ